MIRSCLAAMLILVAAPGLAQSEAGVLPRAADPAGPAVPGKMVEVQLETAHGPITLALEAERAPLTTANFLKYIDQKRFDGTGFYRAYAIPGHPGLGLVQGGAKSDPKRVLPAIPHEPTSKTGLTHTDGAISMARGAPGTAQGDFFIILGDLSSLDAKPDQSGDNQGFAVFGHVSDGMDVVRKILAAPVSATQGVGAMQGQMIEKPVVIRSARRRPR